MPSALILLGPTVTNALTSTPFTTQLDAGVADINPGDPKPSWRVRVFGDVPFSLAVNVDGADATSADFPVAAELRGVTVIFPPGGYVSVVKRGSGADGTIWLSRTKKSA